MVVSVQSKRPTKDVIAAIGNFDGVHRGHQALLLETRKFAADHQAEAGVVVFHPHPRRFFRPGEPPFRIMSPEMRDRTLKTLKIPHIFSLTFDQKMMALSPAAFVEEILLKQLCLSGVVVGEDFRFGKDRAGDGERLNALGEQVGLKVRLVAPLPLEG